MTQPLIIAGKSPIQVTALLRELKLAPGVHAVTVTDPVAMRGWPPGTLVFAMRATHPEILAICRANGYRVFQEQSS